MIYFVVVVVVVVLLVDPPDHGSATLKLPEHSSITTPSLGKLLSSLPVTDVFIFAKNCLLLLYMSGISWSVTVTAGTKSDLPPV